MAGLVIDDGIKESDYGYVLRVPGPCKCLCFCSSSTAKAARIARPCRDHAEPRPVHRWQDAFPKLCRVLQCVQFVSPRSESSEQNVFFPVRVGGAFVRKNDVVHKSLVLHSCRRAGLAS